MPKIYQGLTATRCECGAITVVNDDIMNGEDFTNCMKRKTFRKIYPGMRTVRGVVFGSCDHCVNHWGIDICGCGSGKPVGKCDNEYRECRIGASAQVSGQRKASGIEAIRARGGF